MKKANIVLLVVFMTISVLGIRMMQVKLRENDIKLRDQQFYYTINQILYDIVNKTESLETERYLKKIQNSSDTLSKNDVFEFVFKKENKNTNEVFAYKHLVLEKGLNLKFPLSEKQFDSVFGKLSISQTKSNFFRKNKMIDQSRGFEHSKLGINSKYFSRVIKDISVIEPIYKRVSKDSLKNWIDKELFKRGINYHYEFGILNDGILTKVHSKHFSLDKDKFKFYRYKIFPDNTGMTKYELVLAFNKNELFKHESMRIQFLSDLLMAVILLIYILTIYFIIRQKKISEMKTDFINNMTHEFKTPIATINLITDAMKSPRVMSNEKMMNHYLNMLKQENKRMLNQVENVLNMSVLDKIDKKLEISPVNVHEVLDKAIDHINLIIKDKKGYLNKNFQAEQTKINGDEVLLTNVFVNILDNAVKYSKEVPEIDIKTYNDAKGNVVIEISDKGIGMSRSVQKKVFDKFYRAPTGNIHNVKGHGLGLAYVLKVVRALNGKISVKSIKDKGSTFIIKFPIVK